MAPRNRPQTVSRPVLASRMFLWATVVLVIFAILALPNHAILAALSALAAVVLGEVTR